MNVTSEQPGPLLLMKEENKPVRWGSLPFKKRRFPIAWSSFSDGGEEEIALFKSTTTTKTGGEWEDSGLGVPLVSTKECRMAAETSAEGIAALALVAAAAEPSVGSFEEETKSSRYYEEPKKHGFSFYHGADQSTCTGLSTPLLTNVLAIAAAELQELEEDPSSDSNKRSTTNRPLLDSPLPNGCHGRTSRNNSYCRRHPCYKGSMYCKLHYQHYVLAGKTGDVEAVGEAGVDGGETDSDPSNLNMSFDNPKVAVQHQDKRYTGCPTEIRCKATTTRGRDCAYCAVTEKKYCYLHADYDTNPPPRRGGASTGSTVSAKRNEDARTYPSSPAKESSPAAPSPKRKSTSARRLSTTKNLEKHMADAPYPLLSTLATDSWYQRKVIVSTGPLANHVGLVEKWGNGWISVRLPGVGLHNRRSFELYLHPEQDLEGGTTSLEAGVPVVEVFVASESEKSVTLPNLHRSISNENDTTRTPLLRQERPVVNSENLHEVTPLTSRRVMEIEKHGDDRDGLSPRVSSIMFPTCIGSNVPVTVPESPIPAEAKTAMTGRDQSTVLMGSTDESGESKSQQRRFKLSLKSPSKARSEEMPLSQSILLAQEGGVPKHKLGLLFGTAALERSRRNTHKPTRYEDTGLMAKHNKKRDHESAEEGKSGPRKRACSEVSDAARSENFVTVVISSSSDEESSDMPVTMFSV